MPNPLEIAPLQPDNAKQAAYALIAETGVTAMATAGAGAAVAGPASAGSSLSVVPETTAAVHGNSLSSLRPTWGYRLFQNDGTFLKNGITSQTIPEARYTKAFMSDKYMVTDPVPFPNRLAARIWERLQNTLNPGPLNLRR